MGRRLRVNNRWLAWLMATVFLPLVIGAGEPGFQALLVWGTNNDKPEGAKLTELDPKAREKLRQFKWKNYWVVNEVVTGIGTAKPTQVKLSDKCAIDLKDLGNGLAEIRLFELKKGVEPKLVKPVQHPLAALKKGEYCILAGDDKAVWDDAWFVIVTAAK
ncbi:MAG TPA: hypothetical protein DCE44_07975 [Verrucomicrobiales bacterium]|nr:hypothetical protein [Verrucomicrobiales bacterium]